MPHCSPCSKVIGKLQTLYILWVKNVGVYPFAFIFPILNIYLEFYLLKPHAIKKLLNQTKSYDNVLYAIDTSTNQLSLGSMHAR